MSQAHLTYKIRTYKKTNCPLGMKCICEPKRIIPGIFFKYGDNIFGPRRD
jgi:hypothetical protein